ncbi:MAG TPA: hypothetical protein VK139_05980 [Microbacteriaceae bacterium]|nr:hypothetical protein [Microbacteriaceae bacterium]
MTENELLASWARARNQLIVAQLAPTFLLITTVGIIDEIRATGTFAVWATLGILLASGILGALAEFGAAADAKAIAEDLASVNATSASARATRSHARWLWVPMFLTPAIFVGIFVALAGALLS